jgi:hypothetical protein
MNENRWCWIFECWSYWNLIVGVPLGVLWGGLAGWYAMKADYLYRRGKYQL